MENTKNKATAPFNKVLYLLFIAFAGYQVFIKRAYIDSVATLGIALAFDPFDAQQSWNDRPTWQKIGLFAHLAAVGLGVGIGDK